MEPEAHQVIHALGLPASLLVPLALLASQEHYRVKEIEDLAFLPRKAFLLVQDRHLPLVLSHDPSRIVVIGPSAAWAGLEAARIVDYSEGKSAGELWWRIKRSMLGTVMVFSWGTVQLGTELILDGRKLELSPAGESIFRVLLRLWPKHPWVLPRVLYPPRSGQGSGSRVLAVHIRVLRQRIALHLGSDTTVIRTSRGNGYGLSP